jgi:NADPH-dependent 2,4-dienoyl-CoA reductase/sulfur reductase-like enzyme
MKNVNLAVIGAGPAGLSAAIEAAKYGVKTVIIDENLSPGGQLFKQIHKFFGSKDQMAGSRGFEIGEILLSRAKDNNVEIMLNAMALGIDEHNTLAVIKDGLYLEIHAQKIILCCGATEKPLAFPGWTLPGVMGAGAVQTLVNIHRVIPGKRIWMIGSGNVGLIVTYHLLQAGVKVQAIIDAAQAITGYSVHAAKVRRAGIPFMLGYTVNRAIGKKELKKIELIMVDEKFNKIPSAKMIVDADILCLAVGLSPSTELARMAGCKIDYHAALGGYIPAVNESMQTSVKDIYAAGDMIGIEEASIAMEEGRLAGLSCAVELGYCTDYKTAQKAFYDIRTYLNQLRCRGGQIS